MGGKLALLYPHDVGFMLDLSAKNDWIWIWNDMKMYMNYEDFFVI